MIKPIIHEMTWSRFTLYTITEREGTIHAEVYKEPQGYFKVKGFICNLWVKPEYRKQGIATKLLQRAERLLKEKGINEMFLKWNEHDTPKAIYEWYKRNGYEYVGGIEDKLMRKNVWKSK